MKNLFKILLAIIVAGTLYYCNKKADNKEETILTGNLKILVDETISPIIVDEIMIFEDQYNAKISIDSKSEAEVLQAFFKDSLQVAILSNKLTEKDSLYFVKKEKLYQNKPHLQLMVLHLLPIKRQTTL